MRERTQNTECGSHSFPHLLLLVRYKPVFNKPCFFKQTIASQEQSHLRSPYIRDANIDSSHLGFAYLFTNSDSWQCFHHNNHPNVTVISQAVKLTQAWFAYCQSQLALINTVGKTLISVKRFLRYAYFCISPSWLIHQNKISASMRVRPAYNNMLTASHSVKVFTWESWLSAAHSVSITPVTLGGQVVFRSMQSKFKTSWQK